MRFARNRARVHRPRGEGCLKVGFVPTLDSAPLLVAQELGLFQAHGLDVHLQRELGWATVREKLLHDELDAAVAHASLLFSIYFGLGGVRRPCVTGLLFGHHGTAITLSTAAWHSGVRDAASLAAQIRHPARARRFKAGVPLEYSAPHLILDRWLRLEGLQAGVDLDVAFVPSNLMPGCLQAGHLDLICVAEPWNSVAALAGDGVVTATGADLKVDHADTALVVMQDLADDSPETHERLLAAILQAAEFCSTPENREELARILAARHRLDLPIAVLRHALDSPIRSPAAIKNARATDEIRFSPMSAVAPTRENARQVYDTFFALADETVRQQIRPESIRRIFREDIFTSAQRRARSSRPSIPPKTRDPNPRAARPVRPAAGDRVLFNLDPQRPAAICPVGALV